MRSAASTARASAAEIGSGDFMTGFQSSRPIVVDLFEVLDVHEAVADLHGVDPLRGEQVGLVALRDALGLDRPEPLLGPAELLTERSPFPAQRRQDRTIISDTRSPAGGDVR